jgi:hypothetical protein
MLPIIINNNSSRLTGFSTLTRHAAIIVALSGIAGWFCSLGCAEKHTYNTTMTSTSNFNLQFRSEGGFGSQTVDITVRKKEYPPISISIHVGNQPAVRRQYSFTDGVWQKIEAILRSGVLELKPENRKTERAGRDLACVTIEYSSGAVQKAIVRDYRWGDHFENSFHMAEELFNEIATASEKSIITRPLQSEQRE